MARDKDREAADRLPDPATPIETDHKLDECAKRVLDWVGSLDPAWATRIQILQEERGFGPKEAAGSLISYVLDTAQHMAVNTNTVIQNSMTTGPKGELTCIEETCGKVFRQKYGGQRPLCSNECARTFDAKTMAMKLSANAA